MQFRHVLIKLRRLTENLLHIVGIQKSQEVNFQKL